MTTTTTTTASNKQSSYGLLDATTTPSLTVFDRFNCANRLIFFTDPY
jgi:hypothetical protein